MSTICVYSWVLVMPWCARVRLHSSSLRDKLRRQARSNRSVSPSGSPDPWAAVPLFGSLVRIRDPGAEAIT
ncbi:hypothetical protein Taro_038064, partial [Colocasia esculenta]|nr:hypothetical protein [Colocasia esculenta]